MTRTLQWQPTAGHGLFASSGPNERGGGAHGSHPESGPATAALHPGQRIGAVIWESGATFPAQAPALGVDIADRGPVTGVAWYWGDLDPKGVRIAIDAARVASVNRVAPIKVPVEPRAAYLAATVTSPGRLLVGLHWCRLVRPGALDGVRTGARCGRAGLLRGVRPCRDQGVASL